MIIDDKQSKLIGKWLADDKFKIKLSVNHIDMLHQILREKVYNDKQQNTLNNIRDRWISYKGINVGTAFASKFEILSEDGNTLARFGEDEAIFGYHIGCDPAIGEDHSTIIKTKIDIE